MLPKLWPHSYLGSMTRARRDFRGRVVLSMVALVMTSAAARGQCPDGTPPPCRSAATTPLRRANPPLNVRAWIVVPFANVMKVPELDWLRDASVNLLTLDLSRWTDIAVVDDKRVGDLVRELPPARAAAALTLSDGLALARRAGAGTLVMGDFYKTGSGARIAANVFDVKTGNRLRAATQQAPNADSLLTAFGPLARGVLALPPPAGTRLGATGTTSVDAYREFLLGSTALNRFELTDAVRHLRTSLALDSTFALAHYKLSLAFHLDRGDAQAELDHAASAVRLGVALPPRERALLAARLASSSGDDPHACATLGALVARDSSDVEALYALGDCEYHGGWSAPLAIDSTRARFRGNWNRAVALFRRVLQLDPSYHPAFAHVLDILSSGLVSICRSITMACGNDPTTWVAVVIRDSDSLLIQPVRIEKLREQITRAEQSRSRYYNLRAAQAVARDWVDAGPTEARAHLGLAEVQMLLGVIDSADAELRNIDSRADISTRRAALVDRIDINVRMGRGAAARAALDSLRRETPDESVVQRLLGVRAAALGHIRSVVPAIEAVAAYQNWSRERLRYTLLVPGLLLGVPAPTLNEEERRYWVAAAGDSVCAAGLTRCRVTALLPTLAYALQAPRTWWPPFITYPIGFRFQPAYGMALHRADSLRASLQYLDSMSRARFAAAGDEQMTSVMGADVALVLHDSATALRLVRQFTDSVMPALSRSTAGIGAPDGWWMLFAPRMMLQRGDLAAAMGYRDEARTWYTRVLDLWSDADPELQPTVNRIRAALASLGRS